MHLEGQLYTTLEEQKKDLDDPIWYATWAEKGLEAIMKQSYEKEEPAGSESFVEKRLAAIEKALEVFNTQDPEQIKMYLSHICTLKTQKNWLLLLQI